jgi:hypothetical protein
MPNQPDMVGPLNDLEAFENEWWVRFSYFFWYFLKKSHLIIRCEVEIPWRYIQPILSLPSTTSTPTTGAEKLLDENDVPHFLHDEIEKRNLDGKLYKIVSTLMRIY